MNVRLDKLIADAGLSSRREARTLISSGRVAVNGVAATSMDMKLDPETADVRLDGAPMVWRKLHYYMLDKPAGVVSATNDRSLPTVLDLLPRELRKFNLAPVGRLDRDTTGLLLITDDGDFAHRVISPRSNIEKVYVAHTEGTPLEADIAAFERGIELANGEKCLPARLEILGECLCRVTVREGKYHQVKRMLASIGAPVKELRRVSVGLLHIDEKLGPGGFRELYGNEKMLALGQKTNI